VTTECGAQCADCRADKSVEAVKMADIVLKRKAYVKPLLHAAKYPHCAVNGVLLAEQQKHKEDKVLKLVDAVPLLHTSLTLTPMIEVALCMVSDELGFMHLIVCIGHYGVY
jgi:hypothetical protein